MGRPAALGTFSLTQLRAHWLSPVVFARHGRRRSVLGLVLDTRLFKGDTAFERVVLVRARRSAHKHR